MEVSSPQTTGQLSGEYMPWFAFGPAEELPGDQQTEDAGSLVFDTEVLSENLAILGNPTLRVGLRSNQPQALVAARLCDVWPDGSSTLITRGILNLSQRGGKSTPRSMIPGEIVEVEVGLNHVGYVVPRGHRLRLSISTSYWPIAWPAPKTTTLTLKSEQSSLGLPLLRSENADARLTHYGESIIGDAEPMTMLRPVAQSRRIFIDETTRLNVLEIKADNGKSRFERTGMEMGSTTLCRFAIGESDPLSAMAEYQWEWEFGRGEWQVKTHTYTRITADASFFYLYALATAWEGGEQVFNKQWDQKFERDHF